MVFPFRRLLFSVALLLFAMTGVGCDAGREADVPCTTPEAAPAGPIVVQTDCAAYAPADSFALSFRNMSEQTYVFGPCGVSLERREGDTWAAVEGCSFGPATVAQETGEMLCNLCLAYAVSLPPAADSEYGLDFLLYEGLRAGTYRARAELSASDVLPDEREPVLGFSNAFEVR